MGLVWQARVKTQTWFDAVLGVIDACARQLLAVAESIGCFVWAAAICLWGGIVIRGMGKLLPFYVLCAVLSFCRREQCLHAAAWNKNLSIVDD